MINSTQNPSFRAASDINLRYILQKHSQYLPPTMLGEVKKICRSNTGELPTLKEVHAKVYAPLFNAKSIEEIKPIYDEFSDVLDITSIASSRSKAIKAIQEKMPLEKFTLEYIKQLYTPTTILKLVDIYGFSSKSILHWINQKLNIKKLSTPYLALLRMSDERENQRIAECSRQAILKNPEVQKLRLAKAAKTHKTPEYRAKKRQEMIDFYQRNPEVAMRTGQISKMTWDLCPNIKQALSDYTQQASPMLRSILNKRRYQKLTDLEQRALHGYYKGFWDSHPEYKEIYQKARLQVIKELGI